MYFTDLKPDYAGRWPSVSPAFPLGANDAEALIDRRATEAVAWAREAGLPFLVGKPGDVRVAEVYRAEWFRQGGSDHDVLRGETSATSQLMFMDTQMSRD